MFTRVVTEGRRQITILKSLPIRSKVLILILGAILIPFVLALTFSIILILVFAIPGIFLGIRWVAMLITRQAEDSSIHSGDMKLEVPIFYATEEENDKAAICILVVGISFGGIHCAGWFFDFPSSAEAMLWRVSSAVLVGVAFLFPILFSFVGIKSGGNSLQEGFSIAVFSIIILVYVTSRLLLLVEAFISLRDLTPGMLALVKWTSYIPHI